jgi:hypothetical protein
MLNCIQASIVGMHLVDLNILIGNAKKIGFLCSY